MSTHHASPLPDENTPSVEIYQQFRGLIVSGQLGGGERLPSVRQVAKDLDVALGTAAKAYKMLERDGLVVSRTGAGTRVAETAAVLPANVVTAIRGLVELARHENLKPEDVISALRGSWSVDR